MKGFIKVNVTDNATPVIVNIQTISHVWNDNPTIANSSIKLTTRNSQGSNDILRVNHAVWVIEEMIKEALKDN